MKQKEILYGNNIKEQRQVASLTKMMTYYTVSKIIEELDLDINYIRFVVSSECFAKKGTTASLNPNDVILQIDLLYGMMLPSGNDAAHCLCENLGKLLLIKRSEDKGQRVTRPLKQDDFTDNIL